MIEKFVCFAKGGLAALLCVAFVQVGVAGYSVQVTAGQDKGKGTVSVVKLPENGSQADSSVSVILSSEGESAVISAVPANGYKFDKWTLTAIGGGTDVAYLYDAEHVVKYPEYSSVAGVSIVQCLAAFSGKDIAANLDANVASGHVSPSRVSCVFGEAYPALPTPTATGLKFLAWYDAPSGGSLVEPGSTVVARSDEHTLYARWEPMKYTVTLDPGEGRIESGSGTITVTYGDKYPTMPVPVLDRYDFLGWFTAPVGGKEVSAGDEVAITEDATLYARWQIKDSEIEYTVALDGCGATKPGTKSVVLKKGEKLDGIVLPERTGYAFAGYWSLQDASGVRYVKPDGSPDHEWNDPAVATVYAAWTPNSYKVHYFPNGGVGSVVSTNVQYDASFRLAGNLFSRFDGAAFAGWRLADGSAEYASGATVVNLAASGSVCLLAKWEPLGDALNASGICTDLVVATSDGAQAWSVADAGGASCLMSGVPAQGKPSELRASVSGPGTVSFSWCADGTAENTVFQLGDGTGFSTLDFSGPLGVGNWQRVTKAVDRAAYVGSGGLLVWKTSLYREYPSETIVDHTLYVKDVVWKPSGYSTVVFNLNDGGAATFGGGESMIVPHGAKYGDIPDPVRSDRMFVGWTTNGVVDGVVNPATTPVLPADHSLTALWDVEHMGALEPDATFAGADITYDYDGAGHAINVPALEAAFKKYDGVSFAYSVSRTGPWTSSPPEQTRPGSLVTYYQAFAEGYDSYSGTAVASVICQSRVTVRVTGPSKTVPYDGAVKTLSGYDVSIVDGYGLYSTSDFSFSGVSSLAESEVGVYGYGLAAGQFANANESFKDIVFEIVSDGRLEIQPWAELTVPEKVVLLARGKAVDAAYGAYFSVVSDRQVKSATASGLPAGVVLAKGSDGFALSGSPTETGAFDATLVLALADGTALTGNIRFLVDDGAGKFALVPAAGFAGADVTAEYDGAAHTIDADAVAAAYAAYGGAKVEYAAAKTGPWSTTPPGQTGPGSLTTHYVVSAEGYNPVTNSAAVTVERHYAVTLDPGAGRLAGDDVIVAAHGGKYPALPAPARDRYDFLGWFTSATGGTQVSAGDAVDLSGDATLYAHWQIKASEIEHTIALDGCGATTQGTASLVAKTDSELGGISLPRRTGYAFGGYWSEPNGAGVCYISADGLAVSKWSGAADATIYAAWTPNVYKVYYLPNGGFGEAFSTNVEYDAAFPLAGNAFTPPAGTSAFAGWQLADGTVKNAGAVVSNLVASGSVSLLAKWTPLADDLNASGVCGNLSVTTSSGSQSWSVTNSDECVCLMSGVPETGKPSALTGAVSGPGTVRFSWCATGTTSRKSFYADPAYPVDFAGEAGFGKWQGKACSVSAAEFSASGGKINWQTSWFNGQGSDHVLYLKDVIWIPDGYYDVAFDLADGGAGATFAGGERMTVEKGRRYGDLPDPEWAGHVFQGWTTNGVASGKIDPATTVALPADHALTALWANQEAAALAPAAGYPGADAEYGYNGSGRTINVDALAAAFSAYDGVSFEYSAASGGPWSATPPALSGLGSLVTYVRASAAGYDSFATSAVVKVVHDSRVTVKVTGPSATYDYDGSEKTLSGFDVAIEDEYGLYTAADFSFNGVSNLAASAVGEYAYGLKAGQFSNLNPEFTDVVFKIVADGLLDILPVVSPLAPAAGFAGADASFDYNGGGGRTIDTDALAAAFPGATLSYAASPDGPWTAAAPELFGLGSLVTYARASADGHSDFVTSAVVRVSCDSPVVVRVSGPSKTCYFDGEEKTLSGFDVEISGGYGLYSAHAFSFAGVSNLTETAVGEYSYGLKPGDFANLDPDFTDVSFEIKSDGKLAILAGPEVKFVGSTIDLELNQPVDSSYGAYFTVDSARPVASGTAQGLPAGVSLDKLPDGKFVLSGTPSGTGNFEATLEFALEDGTAFSGSATFCVKSGEVKPKQLVPAAGFAGADASYDYDGAGHTIDTNALAAAFAAYGSVTLEYSATPTGSWSAVAPAFRGPGSAVTYCRASADGYDAFSTSAVVRVVYSAPVTVKVAGPSKTYVCDGTAKTLSGFEVEIVDAGGLYSVDDFSFSGVSNLVATAAGVYVYGLKPGQFANRNADFSNVVFEIVADGRLEIVDHDEPLPVLGPLWPNDGPYDGSAARVYDGWAIAPGGVLAAVVQLRAAKLQTRKGVTSFTATATVKDEAAKSWSYSKGVGTAAGVVTGLVSTARNVPVQSFGATLGADNLAGEWGGCEIFGARAGMGVKGDKMADALEAYRGSWTLMLTNAAGTTRLQLVVGARGSTKISGDVADASVAGGYKVNATVQSVMGEDGLYVPYLAVLRKGAFSLNASLLARLTPAGAVTVFCSGFGPLVAGGRTVAELGEISYPEDDPPRAGEVFSAFVSVNDLAYPVRFSARGLPAGLRINATSGEISGTPTKPGVYRVVVATVSGINSKVKVERTLTITVNNFVDGLIPVKDSYGPARVGVKFMLELAGSAAGTSASGLPAGLKFATRATKDSVFGNVPAWTVYGVPTKAVTNAVIFKKSGKDPVSGRTVTHVASSTLPVEGLDPWARGNFAGAAFANSGDDDPNGLLPSLSVSAAGKLSGKFIDADGATWTLSAPAYDEYDPAAPSYSASVLCKNGKLVATNQIELLARDLGGEAYGVVSGSDPIWSAWQSPWANEPWKSKAKQFAGRQLVVEDGAGGTITLKLAAAGAVSAKLATTAINPRTGAAVAYSATCSSTLVPLGGDQYEVFVHFPPKATATVDFPGRSLSIPFTP